MNKVGIKRLLIYKNHIFPETRKPIRAIPEYLMIKNPEIDRLKAKKMAQLLDQQQKKRIRVQKDIINQEINLQLQKYYRKYIQPFQNCPDYYAMLFKYAVVKTNSLLKQIIKKQQEPFYFSTKEIKQVIRTMNSQLKIKQGLTKNDSLKIKQNKLKLNENRLSLLHQISQNTNNESQPKSQEELQLLFQVYRHLYPSQKLFVYKNFMREYKQFLVKQQQISHQLLENKLIHIKQFLFSSPLQLYQSKNPDTKLNQCENYLINNVNQRQKVNLQFIQILKNRHHQIELLVKRFDVNIQQVWNQYRSQYYRLDKYLSFYSMLKNN